MPYQDSINTLQNFNKSGALCKYLCMSRTQFHKLLKEGRFPAPYRMGGVNVWAKADILAWLESNRQAPATAPNDTQGGV